MKCHAGLRFAFLVALVLTTKFAAIAEPPAQQQDAVTHDSLGNALSAKGDLDGAIAEYRTAISQWPKFPYAHNNLGNTLEAKGDLDGAVAEFRAAIGHQPSYPEAQSALDKALEAKVKSRR